MKQTISQQKTTVSSEISVVKEEAYFLFHGEAQKGHAQPSEEAPTLPDYKLMSLDLDFDPLRKYLNSVSTVVNQHASMINSLSGDVRTKITDIPVSEALNQIGNSTMLFDAEFNKQVYLECDKPRSETNGRPLEDNMNKLCNKMNMIGHALTFLFKHQTATDKTVEKLQGDMASKVEKDEFKAKIKKTKLKIRKQMAENFTALDTKIVETDKKLLERIKALEKKVSEVEVSTIWRIKDCEDLLKSRVNDQFVLEACKTLEEKLMRELVRVTEGNSSNLTSIYTDLKVTVERLIEDHADKTKKTKGRLDDLEDLLNKKLAIVKFEEVKKVIFDRLDDLAKKLKDYSGKVDPALEKINATLKVLQDNAADLEKRVISLNEKCDGVAGKVSMVPRAETPSPTGGVAVDGSRLGELEGLLRDLKREQQNTSILISSIQVEIKDKVDSMTFNLQLGKKMDKDEAMRLLEAGGSSEEKLKKLQREVDDLVKKFEALGDSVEKRIAKLRKELDINAIMKLIKGKVDQDQLKKELDTVEGKLGSLADLLQTLKRDYENVHYSLKRMNQYFLVMQTGSTNNDALLSTKACLSCGKGDVHFVPPVHTLKGSDGKIYAGKMTSSMGESLRADYDLGIEVFGQREGQATTHMESRHHHHSGGKMSDSISTVKALKPTQRVGSRDRPISAKMSKDNLKSTNLVATSIHLSAQNQSNLPHFRPTSAKQ